ncbi:MAG: RHS repeat-associated core domain-containing protein [Ferruginibacter sp.]
MVLFDNIQVVHTRGAILEETNYYPFGLIQQGISSKAVGVLENKKRFNGVEFENSFDLNIGETFFRNHDPQLGRWWQIDPKSEKYYCLATYNTMANNPLLIFDPLGDDLILNGSKKNVQRAIDDMNSILEGYYVLSIDSKGKVVITGTEKKDEISGEAKGFFKVLSNIVENKNGTVEITIVNKDSKVDLDSWANGKIDIADVEKTKGGKYMNIASMLAHSLAEQESKQITNANNSDKSVAAYLRDHAKGIEAEAIVTGYERSPSELDGLRNNIFGNTTGVFTFYYVEPAKAPSKEKYIFHQVEMKFKNGNVKSVKEIK